MYEEKEGERVEEREQERLSDKDMTIGPFYKISGQVRVGVRVGVRLRVRVRVNVSVVVNSAIKLYLSLTLTLTLTLIYGQGRGSKMRAEGAMGVFLKEVRVRD
jgi:hypothetical protein